jgi:hypothetical protein
MLDQQLTTNAKQQDQKGFTLFIAIIIMGTLFLAAAAVASLAVRQSLISASGRESQHAFYAADTGIECVLFWDIQNPAGISAFSTTTGSNINCNNQTRSVGGSSVSTFSFDLAPDPYCVIVRVEKNPNGSTEIESRGYNTCDSANPRRVERAIRASY